MSGEGETRADSALGDALCAAVGDSGVHAITPPASMASASLSWHVEPTDVDGLAEALRTLDEAKCPALVRGGGSRLESGRGCPQARVLLSTRGLSGVLEFEPDEGVIEVAAGTKLLDVVDHLGDTIWELPLDAPGEDATVGGVLAAAAQGPRCVGYGPVRHQVLGLEVVLADGTRTHCGGRVVKNVTGYDLAKLHVGGEGAFGVITSAWLRLRARPEATRTLALPFDDRSAAVAAARAAARLPSARMACLLSGDLAGRASGLVDRGAAWVLAVELAGSQALCARDGDTLLEGPRSSERRFSVDAVGAVMVQDEGHALQASISLLPSELDGALELLHGVGLSAVAHPDPGLLEVCLDSTRGEDVETARAALESLEASVSGRIVISQRIVDDARACIELGVEEGERDLLVSLKRRFDPNSILNPARLGEGI